MQRITADAESGGNLIKGFQVSSQQEHLWAIQQADNSQVYRSQCVIRVDSGLDSALLKAALDHLIGSYEILRTRFQRLPGRTILLQVIDEEPSLWFEASSIDQRRPDEHDACLDLLMREMRRTPFDFERGPLVRVHHVKLSAERDALILDVSALCADAASLRLITEALKQSYEYCLGKRGSLEVEMHYADFAQWQCEARESEDAEAGRRYWRKKGIGKLLKVDLPSKKRAGASSQFEPGSIKFDIESAVAASITEVSRQYQTTSNAMLLSVWAALIWRLTGQSELVIGVGCDGRKYAELETVVGRFWGYLPLFIDLAAVERFSELMKRAQQAEEQNYLWQDAFNWGDVARTNEPDDSEPYCAVSYEFQREPLGQAAAQANWSISLPYDCGDRFELKLAVVESEDALRAELFYDSHYYEVEQVKKLCEQFKRLVQNAAASPEALTGNLEILSRSERHQLLVDLNNTVATYDINHTIHQLIEVQARRRPEAIAAVYEGQHLSYSELNARANQLAGLLIALGVAPDLPVGLCMERSLDLLIGLLAILKAGGAYVPLDPAYPDERLAYMLRDSRSQVLLTQKRRSISIPIEDLQVVDVESDSHLISQHSRLNPCVKVCPLNLVYVIYTSGSTGKPKGVAVEHRQLVNYSIAISRRIGASAGESYASLSTIAADLGNTAIFPSLITGGCLHLIAQDKVLDAAALAEYFGDHRISYMKVVPSHLAALHRSAAKYPVMPRKRLILGGEASSYDWVERLCEGAPECEVMNHYGPTEATVGVLTYEVNGHEKSGARSGNIPLGRPIENARAYILDERLEVTPIEVNGQIYLSGEGVARGYLMRPDLTAERFIPDPHSQEPGTRMYKTGDRARYSTARNIEFIGRIDHQVKIKGYRIELAEIEAALEEHNGVSRSVVMLREDEPDAKQLTAYVEWRAQSNRSSEELRRHLREKLPEYMIPTAWVAVDRLPLTANGKIDRSVLPAPGRFARREADHFIAPRTDVERCLVQIWSGVLGVEQIGIQDNFFRLGGDSILSIQIISKARQASLHFTAKDLFQHQTIAELSAAVGERQAVRAEQGLVVGEVPLTPIQHRFFEQNLPDASHYNQYVLLQVRQPLSVALLRDAVRRLLWYHDALRMRFIREGSIWRQIHAESSEDDSLWHIDLSALPGEAQTVALRDTVASLQASLDLTRGPLIRAALFELGPQHPQQLLITIHHLVVDSVSWRILIEDLQTVYKQMRAGEVVQLPAKTTSYKQWSEFLSEYVRAGALAKATEYWLNEMPTRINILPADFNRGPNLEACARVVESSLDVENTEALLRGVPELYQTRIEDLLLTALAKTLIEWAGGGVVLFDVEGHGREELFAEVNLSRTVGWFTSIYPLAVELEAEIDAGAALKHVKERLRAIPGRGESYGLLRYLSGDAKVAEKLRAPAAQVCFNYLGQFDHGLSEELFTLGDGSSGYSISQRAEHKYLLSITGRIIGKQLKMTWRYSDNKHSRRTVEELSAAYMTELKRIIAHCLTDETGGYTPSDFPEAELSQEEIDRLMTEYGQAVE